MIKSIAFTLLFLASFSLTAQTTITYQTSTADFANPERGFYRYSSTNSTEYSLLDQSTLEGYRLLHSPFGADYSIYSTLVFRYFFLEDFKTSAITQDYLDNMQIDFNTARAAGVKLIPRFAYTETTSSVGCAGDICPPYGDASKTWVLSHIAQLQPVLEANKDVIATVQMGFIGIWGENYYTDFFGDASQAPDYKLLDNNWTDRIDVVNELLNVVPDERMLQVRYPQQKQRAIYGINAPTNSAALTLAEAFAGTDKARLGFHNDCLLASADDFGTFTDYGNSSSSSMSDTTNLKPYFNEDSKFVVVGGETCSDGYSPQNDCASSDPSAYGDTEIERMHYSYLNAQFNNDVNNDWETDGCMDEIKKRLGYRLELQEGTFSDAAQPNQVIEVDIDMKNVGYASPYNERGVALMLRNTATSEVWFVELDDDPRFWFADNSTYNITETICIPGGLPLGTYDVLLNLPDPMPSLTANPDYSIRLANLLPDNSDVWESATGFNDLGHTITIDNVSANATCNGEVALVEWLGVLPVELVAFRASPDENNILVSWETSNELNNKGFQLERSTDSKNFTNIGWIAGQGDSGKMNHYSFVDRKVERGQTYYYRLIQQDFDGAMTQSNIVSAKINEDDYPQLIKIYPNPAHDQVVIDTDGIPANLPVQINLLNSLGVKTFPVMADRNVLNISELPEGVYFLELIVGSERTVRKLVKQ